MSLKISIGKNEERFPMFYDVVVVRSFVIKSFKKTAIRIQMTVAKLETVSCAHRFGIWPWIRPLCADGLLRAIASAQNTSKELNKKIKNKMNHERIIRARENGAAAHLGLPLSASNRKISHRKYISSYPSNRRLSQRRHSDKILDKCRPPNFHITKSINAISRW